MWFNKDKILFACNKCGECCRDMDIPLTHYDIFRIIKSKKIEPHDFIAFKPAVEGDIYALWLYSEYQVLYLANKESDNSCIFLENNQCTIYSQRPNSCQTFPFYKTSLNKLTIAMTAEEMVERHCDKKNFKERRKTLKVIDQGISEVLEYEKLIKSWNKEVRDNIEKQTLSKFIQYLENYFQ